MKLLSILNVYILIFLTGCVFAQINRNRSINSITSEIIYPFDIKKVRQSINEYRNRSKEINFKNLLPEINKEYYQCKDSPQDSKVNKLFLQLFDKIDNDSTYQIKLKNCSFESHFVSWVETSSVYYDDSSVDDIFKIFGKNKGDQILTLILAHEIAHFIHEFVTQEKVSGKRGLSLNGTIARYQFSHLEKDYEGKTYSESFKFNEDFLREICSVRNEKFQLVNNEILTFSSFEDCVDFARNSEHNEVDIIGLEVAHQFNNTLNLSLFNSYLKYYSELKTADENDDDYRLYVEKKYKRRSTLINEGIEMLK